VRTVSVIEHTFPDLLSDAEKRMDLAKSADSEAAAVEVLTETIRENDPASSRYQAGLRDDIRKDARSIAVTEFTSSILAPTNPNHSWHRSRQDLTGSRIDL
jgi:hypothetical protein